MLYGKIQRHCGLKCENLLYIITRVPLSSFIHTIFKLHRIICQCQANLIDAYGVIRSKVKVIVA